MIPKIIHYCWFGKNPLPELAVKCIESWKQFCPDYKIKEWNESNFNLDICPYVREAYKARKWAFITDYVRIYVLVNEGGIYMDTDVEVLKPIDRFLSNKAFSGFEKIDAIPTGIMACERGFSFFQELLEYYANRHFIQHDGSYDLTTNVSIITKICLEYGLVLNNTKQTIRGFTLYPKDVFCPKNYCTGVIECTKRTYTIHHFSGSWHSKKQRIVRKREEWLYRNFGRMVAKAYSLPYRIRKKWGKLGTKGVLMFAYYKIFSRK